MELLSLSQLSCQLHGSLPLLVLHLVPPQPVLVEHGEAVDHDGDGQSEDEDPGHSTAHTFVNTSQCIGGLLPESADKLAEKCCRIHVVSHRGQSHQTPPERIIKRP